MAKAEKTIKVNIVLALPPENLPDFQTEWAAKYKDALIEYCHVESATIEIDEPIVIDIKDY